MAKILYVDDDFDLQDLVKACLSHDGHDVSTVDTGEDPVEAVKTNHFDLILLDLKMPLMTGYEVLHWLRSHPFPSVLVIVLSGSVLMQDVEVSLALGAHGYWSKTADAAKQKRIADEIEALLDARLPPTGKRRWWQKARHDSVPSLPIDMDSRSRLEFADRYST